MPRSSSARPRRHSVPVMLGTIETIRRGGRTSSTATPEASTRAAIRRPARPSRDPPAPQALEEGEHLPCPIGDFTIPLHHLVHRRAVVDRLLEAGHRHVEELQHPMRLVTRHRPLPFPGGLAQASTSSAGESFHNGSPSGLKLRVFTKCKPWCRFILNLPPP